MYKSVRKLILELREDAQHKLEQHTRKCQEYDKRLCMLNICPKELCRHTAGDVFRLLITVWR